MKRGQSGISLMEFPNIDRLNVKIGGQIKGFDPKLYFENQKITFYYRFTQFALIAAKEAILQSGLVFEGELSQYSGVVFGTAGEVCKHKMKIIVRFMKMVKIEFIHL